jgi:hypothetical protein
MISAFDKGHGSGAADFKKIFPQLPDLAELADGFQPFLSGKA